MQDKIEILLATYNGEKYIGELLESLIKQTYTNWVVRVGDDSSTDSTYAILLKYQEKYPDKFIVEKNIPGTGSAKLNFFNLIRKSTCKYVMCCDQDDVWLPTKIELTYNEMKAKENGERPVLVHTDIKVVDSKLNVLRDSFFDYSNYKRQFEYKDLLIQNYVTGCTIMMNRPLVQLVNKEKHYDNILMHDWLIAILAAGKGEIGFVDCATMLYRQHSVNSVGAKQYGISLFITKLKNSDVRKPLVDTTLQAAEIAKTYQNELDKNLYLTTYMYSQIFEKGKCQRLKFYFQYGIFKNGIARKLGQIIFG